MKTAILNSIIVNWECYTPENCDYWTTESQSTAIFPFVVVRSVSRPLCSHPVDGFQSGPEDLHALLQHNGRSSSDEWKYKEAIISCHVIVGGLDSVYVKNGDTWQVWSGMNTGLFRSAVVVFPPAGKRDRKCAEGERENCEDAYMEKHK